MPSPPLKADKLSAAMWATWREIFVSIVDFLPIDYLRTQMLDYLHEKVKHGQEKHLRTLSVECIGKLCRKLDEDTVVDPRRGLLDLALGLCQDSDYEVRHGMCAQLAPLVAVLHCGGRNQSKATAALLRPPPSLTTPTPNP